MKKVYILLMHTNTVPSKLIKLFTKFRYTHVGISLDENCELLYSFGRKRIHSILDSGLTIERKNGAFFQAFHKTRCQIYEIDVTNREHQKLQNILENMMKYQNQYKYDYLGLVLRYFKIPFIQKNKYVCSYFVADVLKQSEILNFSKETYFVIPEDFSKLKKLKLIYEGFYLKYKVKMKGV